MRSPVRAHWNQSRLKTDLLLCSVSGISYLRLSDQRLLWRIYFSSTLCHLSAYSRKLFILYLLWHFTGFFVEIDALVAAELYEKKDLFHFILSAYKEFPTGYRGSFNEGNENVAKIECASQFQPLLLLFGPAQFVKCSPLFLELNS